MGSFYTNHTLYGPSQAEVLAWLKDGLAYVSKTERNITVVLADASEFGAEFSDFGIRMSAHFRCPVLAILNHDDDVLYFELYENGVKIDEYDSNPGFAEDKLHTEPSGGNASHLAAAFHVPNSQIQTIEAILRKTDYVAEVDRHEDLAAALGIPKFAVGVGFLHIDYGDPLPWIPESTYILTNQVGNNLSLDET